MVRIDQHNVLIVVAVKQHKNSTPIFITQLDIEAA